MPLKIIRNDITKIPCDAIVNAANSTLLGGGGVDGAIHKAAGPQLLKECRTLGGCKTGKAKITNGYNLPSKFVIHTVGPVWKGGAYNEEELLRSCYRESLALAKEYGCESVAFPLISSGVYGYPKDKALSVAVEEISSFILQNDMTVYIVVFDRNAFALSQKLTEDIEEYINDNYVDENLIRRQNLSSQIDSCIPEPDICASIRPAKKAYAIFDDGDDEDDEEENFNCRSKSKKKKLSLEDMLKQIDESFSQMLLRLIDEKGMTDAQCYKKANIDRKLFSKIRKDINYKPSKPTVLAFAIALELSVDETKDMLSKAGFALSRSSIFDIIIEFFIKSGNYNIFEINEALFAFDQSLLGG